MNAPITKFEKNIIANDGGPMHVPIIIKDFVNITSVSLTFNYNPTVLDYMSTDIVHFPGLTVSNPTPGTIVVGGISTEPVTLNDNTSLLSIKFNFHSGMTDLTWLEDGSSCQYLGIDSQPLLDTPTSEYYINGSVVSNRINLWLKCWGQVLPVSGYGKADGMIKLHIQDGIAPFRLNLKVNGNLYRTIENIPAPQGQTEWGEYRI